MVQAPLGVTSKPLTCRAPFAPQPSWGWEAFFFSGHVCSFLWARKHTPLFTSFGFCNRFIEVCFTYQEKLPLRVYNVVIFSNFTKWHSRFHKWVCEHFHPLVRILVLIYCS